MPVERWPPIYDADDLQRAIRELVGKSRRRSFFYSSLTEGGRVCQGDVLELTSAVPLIDETGAAVALGEVDYWLVIGNTCDFNRPLEDVSWTQVVPVDEITQGLTPQHQEDLENYRLIRRFFVPPWSASSERVLVADFLRPVAMHKAVAGKVARVAARMSFEAWILLHSCLVRFLGRDDGRLDERPE